MNITELKELAEKATPGPWEWDGDASNYDPENEAPWLAQAPWTSRDSKNVLMGTIKAVRAEDAAYIAAANPAAILELIAKLEEAQAQMERQKDEWLSWEAKRRDLEKAAAKLEDAQGEIRALRATEAGLRERVKALEEVAAALLPFADDASAINGYGYYRPKNPHDFHPDAESCTEDEIAAHKAACEAWDAGTYKDNYGDGWVSPNVHILRAPWGIGSYTDEVPKIAAICNRARALLEKKE